MHGDDSLGVLLPPPRDITAETFGVGNLEFVILEYRLAAVGSVPAELSPAEAHVVELLAQGLSTRAIAEVRGVSSRTLANQLASIYRKVGVNSRGELLVKLMR